MSSERATRVPGVGTIAGLVAAIAITDILVTRIEPPHSDLIVKAAILVGFVGWARRFGGLSWDELGFGKAHVRSGLRVGFLAMLVVGVAIFVAVAVPAMRSYFEDDAIAAASTTEHIVTPLLLIPLGTVVFEETIFRGVLLGTLLKGWSRWQAVIVSSVVFGLWHIPPALTDAHGKSAIAAFGVVAGTVAFTTFAGTIFAGLRLWSGSVLAPMGAHLASNSFAYVGAVVVLHL